MRHAVALAIGVGTLLVGGGVVYAATRAPAPVAGGAGGAGSSGAAGASSGSLPQGQTSSAKTATGWGITIEVQDGVSGLLYTGFYGDVVTVRLPAGCTWRTITGTGNNPAVSPPSGTGDFVFRLIEPMTYELAFTNAARVDRVTTITFEFGGTFAATTALASGDYVILAFAQADLEQVAQTIVSLYGNIADALKRPEYAQEAATVIEASNVVGQKNMTPEAFLTFVTTMGPWADKFGVDVHSFVPFNLLTSPPAWWPSDDTAAASEYHVLYRYVGPGIDVAALPFPAKAWKRTV
jgi:hypothetical protein